MRYFKWLVFVIAPITLVIIIRMIDDGTIGTFSAVFVLIAFAVVDMVLAANSSQKATKHNNPKEVNQDLYGDIINVIISTIILVVWVMLPMTLVDISGYMYIFILVYLFSIFVISIWEIVRTFENGNERLFMMDHQVLQSP